MPALVEAAVACPPTVHSDEDFLDHGASPLVGGIRAQGRVPTTGFYEVKCAQGFTCVSKAGFFGLGHDGNYSKPPPLDLPPRFMETYEQGCPARGTINADGNCEDDGLGGHGGLCYSSKRYEAGPNTPCDSNDKCMCVRLATAHGLGVSNKGAEVIKGNEIQYGRFEVQPAATCDECSQHDCDKEMCDSCVNCEYMTKELEVPDGNGGTYRRRQLGCFKVLDKESKGVDPLLYMGGKKAQERDLEVVPHYKLWDPGEKPEDDTEDFSFRLPYQSRREPLGKEEWILKYKDVAPTVQKTMDVLAMKMLDGTASSPAWSPLENAETGARRVGLDNCWTPQSPGDGIADKVDKFLAAQKVCKRMQETAFEIANGTPFSADASGEHSCGAYAWDEKKGIRQCGCHRGTGRELTQCKALNCYNDREDVRRALEQLKQKLKMCAGAVGLSESEMHDNGPAPQNSTEVQLAGTVHNPKESTAPSAGSIQGPKQNTTPSAGGMQSPEQNTTPSAGSMQNPEQNAPSGGGIQSPEQNTTPSAGSTQIPNQSAVPCAPDVFAAFLAAAPSLIGKAIGGADCQPRRAAASEFGCRNWKFKDFLSMRE